MQPRPENDKHMRVNQKYRNKLVVFNSNSTERSSIDSTQIFILRVLMRLIIDNLEKLVIILKPSFVVSNIATSKTEDLFVPNKIVSEKLGVVCTNKV